MSDVKTTLVWLLRDEVSPTLAKLDKKLQATAATGTTAKGKMKELGGSIGGLINPTTLAIGAIGAVGGVLAEAWKAGVEEQAGIAKLDAALRANIPAWDGNTDAIDRGMQARLDLGFSDAALRQSLTTLIPIVKDVGTAQRVQAAAMDLARYKGIDLETASLAVGKAMMGNKKALKELGIETGSVSGKTETLSAIQKVVAGQAEAYAGTIAGRQAAAAAHVGNAMETLGTNLVGAADKGIYALDYLKYAWDNNTWSVDQWAQSVVDAQQTAKTTASILAGDFYSATKTSADTMSELRSQVVISNSGIGAMAGYLNDAATAAWAGIPAFTSLQASVSGLISSVQGQQTASSAPLRAAVLKDQIAAAQLAVKNAKDAPGKRAAQLALQALKDQQVTDNLQTHGMKTYAGSDPKGYDGRTVTINLVLDGKVISKVVDERLFYRNQRRPT